MSAWPTDERIVPRRRPRPRRWVALAVLSFIAFIAVPAMAPELEHGQDPTAPWAAAFVLAFVGMLVGVVGAIVAAVRSRRLPSATPPERSLEEATEERPTRAGRPGVYVALAGLAIIVVTMIVREAVLAPEPGDDLGPVEGTFATIGVCVIILGLSYWGMIRGQLAGERRMVHNLGGAERIEPTDQEEASLQQAFSGMAARSVRARAAYWAAAAGNPTDVRQEELTVPLAPADARDLGRQVLQQQGAEILADSADLVRAWWFHGGSLNGNPVVVTLAFEADGLGGTQVAIRSAVKFYFSNQDLAQEALDLIRSAMDVHGPDVTKETPRAVARHRFSSVDAGSSMPNASDP